MNYFRELINRQLNRPLIESENRKASYIQLIGFLLISTGVMYLFAKVVIPQRWLILPFDGTRASIVFFIIMLGCSLAFPDLLCDKRKELSTMRIVVFMMVNVMCLLLIKTGWDSKSLNEVGINGYWVSIIAFVFGGKAAQSYFEYKQPLVEQKHIEIQSLDHDEVLHMAIEQNIDAIRKIKGYSDMYIGLSSNPKTPEKTCILINTTEQNKSEYPSQLPVQLASGEKIKVHTEVIVVNAIAKPHAGTGNSICNQLTTAISGTICCTIIQRKDGNDVVSYLTCSHVLSAGEAIDKGGYINDNRDVALSPSFQFSPIGTWYYGKLNKEFDIALVDTSGYLTPAASGMDAPVPYHTGLIGKKVKINGQLTQATAYIIGSSTEGIPFEYNGKVIQITNLIKLSRYPYQHESITTGGDSGALVSLSENNVPLGMVIGSNERYTFISSLTTILNDVQATVY